MAKTESGFEYTLNSEVKDDFEFLELLREYQDNPLLIIDVAKKLLGDDGYKALKAYCTTDSRVSSEKMIKEILEISNKDEEIKK